MNYVVLLWRTQYTHSVHEASRWNPNRIAFVCGVKYKWVWKICDFRLNIDRAVSISVAEHCCPVWSWCVHTKHSTRVPHLAIHVVLPPWLPVLSNISHRSLLRKAASDAVLKTQHHVPNGHNAWQPNSLNSLPDYLRDPSLSEEPKTLLGDR